GRGVMLLSELRRRLTPEIFDPAMDAFGREHAGKPTTTDSFIAAMTAASQRKSSSSSPQDPTPLAAFFSAWLDSPDYLPTLKLTSVHTDHKDSYLVTGSVKSE